MSGVFEFLLHDGLEFVHVVEECGAEVGLGGDWFADLQLAGALSLASSDQSATASIADCPSRTQSGA